MSSFIELLGLFMLLMLPFLYETNHIFRYYFKFLIYYGIVSFNAIVLIPAFLTRPCDVRNLLWASTWCHRVTTLIGLRWELRGKEHLAKDQACIIVANHQSSLDVLGMFNIWHVMNKCTVVAKRELFYVWPFGLAAWLAGLIFIDRVRGEKAREILNDVNRRIKKQRIKLWVFPEGTRRNTGELHPFKKGAFHMAIDQQIPILPVVFSSYCTFLNDKKKILNAGRIVITTLPPVSTEGLTKDDIDPLMERVRAQMIETFKLTSAEALELRYNPLKSSPLAPSSSASSASEGVLPPGAEVEAAAVAAAASVAVASSGSSYAPLHVGAAAASATYETYKSGATAAKATMLKTL
ncbi:1-acyl-sn-glycerol-3-phosphate acyltransferase alpha [Drosophila pseudoobscura]|uniref:1-acyl-sn-glycerol-3-phosphate acyltransferase n=1 Tax=Drosophila pseudoobscura pseudoobscura TaxID=46245 RepID=A0A6I8UFW8_DROPS|nr:1-acyl-sn-glycerol-3-phosphate acyltransferase alpha [Drosophila pseudoobscura]XP_015041747.2 1-acyl-sn-glycerol-3-phosphate acyltransferase alpha [Drosophila pseudoobscura]